MNPRLFNRFRIPSDGWAQFVPVGEYPWFHPQTGEGLIQVVDTEALTKLHNSFPAELFIDKEHLSDDPEHGDAMGWGDGPDNAQIRQDGLYVKPRWSDLGLQNIQGGRLRYVSPVFDGESLEPLGIDERTGLPRFRVTKLIEAGLTNKPNMRGMKPLSNRKHLATDDQPGLAEREAATKEKHTKMKLINRALDLSPDASEDAAIAGIEKLKKDHAAVTVNLTNRDAELATVKTDLAARDLEITNLKTDLANRDAANADAQLDAAGIKEEEPRKRWKNLLVTNRESGKALFDDYVAGLKAAADPKKAREPLTNRQPKNPLDPEKKQELTGLDRTRAAMKAEREALEEK